MKSIRRNRVIIAAVLLSLTVLHWGGGPRSPVASAMPVNFTDLDSTYWAYDDIHVAVQAGYFKGYQDGTFKPKEPVTRAEFAALVSRMSDNEPTSAGAKFNDVPETNWAAEGIDLAAKQGFIRQQDFINGFKPQQALTRIEMARWLAAGLSQANPEYAQAVKDMVDTIAPVTEFYKGGITEADFGIVSLNIAMGLMTGYTDGSFGPSNNTSRAEVAAILLRYEEAQKKDPTQVQVLNEMREIGLTGTNAVAMGFTPQVAGSGLDFKDFRKVTHTLQNGLGYANLNRLIIVDQLKPDHPYYKMFIGKNFSPDHVFRESEKDSYLSFRELIVIPKNDKLHGGTYDTAFRDTWVGGASFVSNSTKSYGIDTLPANKDMLGYFKKDTQKNYWSYDFLVRKNAGGLYDIRLNMGGKSYLLTAPGADMK